MTESTEINSPDFPVAASPPAAISYTGIDHPGEDMFFAAVELTRMPMTVTDPHRPDNPVIFANKAFLRMTGYAMDEIVGQNCRFLQGKDTDAEAVAGIRAAVQQRREYATEILNYRKDGSTFWNALFISPVYDKQGNLVYFFASQLDVSRRRDAEDALRQSQKMEALGQLTGGIAHDFNNILQVLTGFLEGIGHGIDRPELDRPKLHRQIEICQKAVERAGTLTKQLLAFARKQQLEGRMVNVNHLITNMHEMMSRALGDSAELQMDLLPDLLNARIDSTQCEVAMLNIVINARDAMAGRDDQLIRIKTENVSVIHGKEYESIDLKPGKYVVIAISDNGAGMPAEIKKRVMDPFFTTKEEGKGTGLGLSMVYGFARQSGGTVMIDSEENVGTTVRLFFPASEATEHSPASALKEKVVPHSGREHVLVVEDREDVAVLARDILEEYGYRVTVANNAADALNAIDTDPNFDLLFTDLIMPGGMNGVLLARKACQRMPRLKVLLTTGYADSSIERTDARGSEFEVIHKPYGRAELARKVKIVLGGHTGVS